MAQYEPIGLKSGFATNLGTDTLRADLSAVAGLTTAAPAAGDACQISGALTITPAVNTSANPVVGIYDGVSGSVVRRGVVVASFVGGLTLAAGDAVYLSNVAGRLTNVKPTTDNLHEVGVVVSAAASTIMLQIKPVVVLPATMMMFDARSSWLLQGDAPPAYPGEQQPFPSTAASLIAALGATGVILPASVLAIYLANTASPLVDSLGLGPNLVAAGGPLTGRECVGLPGTSFNSKVGCELLDDAAMSFADAGAAFMNVPAGGVRSLLMVVRFNPADIATNRRIMSKEGAVRWWLQTHTLTSIQLSAQNGGDFNMADLSPITYIDGSWICIGGVIDLATPVISLLTSLGDASSVGACPVDVVNAASFAVGVAGVATAGFQLAYLACFDVALTSAMRQSFWRSFNLNEFNTPVAYTRAGPLVAPISASRVAAYGTNQPAVGYNSNFAGTDNLLKSGTVHEDGITFEPIGSDDFYTNTFTGPSAKASVDGPSGMRDGVRVTMNGAWGAAWGNTPAAGFAIVGVSNIPWRGDINYRRATVNTTARMGLYFAGSGAGPELFTLISDAASPVDWVRGGGTCTPVNADQNTGYIVFGGALAFDDCDFGDPAVVKNRSTAPLAWRRVGTAAAAATASPVTSISNIGNARYSPAKGRMTIRFSGMPSAITGNECLLCCGTYGNAGSMAVFRATGNLTLAIYDDAGAPAVVFNTVAIVNNIEHTIIVQWDAAAGTASISEGGVVLGSYTGAAWVPEPTDVTPILVGGGNFGLSAARCFVALENISNY
jgi:hypothetical protein